MSWNQIKGDIYKKWKQYWFKTHPEEIAEYSWEFLFSGGKEIRARLFCELWQYLSPESLILGELAFAIECIHVASLILDDTPWMDNANERRGKSTLHCVFSPKIAVLLCHDVLYMVYCIWIDNKPVHIDADNWINFIREKLQLLMLGQWYDLNTQGSLLELASLKTGILFELVSETVALFIGLDTTFWRKWGNNIGILFQWMDDWNDRDEDIIQCNRNAFNEEYNNTLEQYVKIWKKIENGIGPSWFEKPFGIFMKSYFTSSIETGSIIYTLSDLFIQYPLINPYNISSSYIIKKFHIMDTNDIITKLFTISDYVFNNHRVNINSIFNKYINIKNTLWYNYDSNNITDIHNTIREIGSYIIDIIEEHNLDVLYKNDLIKITDNIYNELQYHTIDEIYSLKESLPNIQDALEEAISIIENRDILYELKVFSIKILTEIKNKQ